MRNRIWSKLAATVTYALLLKLAALALPDPRVLVGSGPGAAASWQRQPGFHVSWFGALLVGALLALALPGIRGWLASLITETKLLWPTLVGGYLASFVIVGVANGILWQQAFFVRGVLGWLVVPLAVWAGTIGFERFAEQLLNQARRAKARTQGQIAAIKQAIQQPEQASLE